MDSAAATDASAAPDDSPALGGVWRDLYISAQDGLVLHAREYGPRIGPRLPVVCLSGLSRNSRDFHELASALASDARRPRRVLALDYRGRGQSQHDRNWRNYDLLTETGDVLAVMAATGIAEAAIVGTSRGGLIAMILAALRPTVLRAVVLNDIGPQVDGRGLLRIKRMLGAIRTPPSWDEAAAMLKRAHQGSFAGIDEAGWMIQARKTYDDRDGHPVIAYDPKLLKTLAAIDFDRPLPAMWAQFDALAHVPVLAIRGANSDIMSAETLENMRKRRPSLETLVLPDVGHAPHLTSHEEIGRISAFIVAAEDRRR